MKTFQAWSSQFSGLMQDVSETTDHASELLLTHVYVYKKSMISCFYLHIFSNTDHDVPAIF